MGHSVVVSEGAVTSGVIVHWDWWSCWVGRSYWCWRAGGWWGVTRLLLLSASGSLVAAGMTIKQLINAYSHHRLVILVKRPVNCSRDCASIWSWWLKQSRVWQ